MTPFGEHPCDRELARYVRFLIAELRWGLGADVCDRTGRIQVLPLWTPRGQRETRLGFADWDGTMGIRTDLLDALRSMCAGSPGQGKPEHWRQRDALHTTRHEIVHSLRLDGQPFREGAEAYRRWAVRLLEEGVTEAVAQNHRLAGAAAAEARSPGLAQLPVARAYREFTPAVRHLAQYVGELRRRPASAVLDDLGRRSPHAKYPTLTRMILEAGGLWELIPESQRPACLRDVEDEISNVASPAQAWARRDDRGLLGTPDPDGRSHVLGLQMVAAAERARLRIENTCAPSRQAVPWELAAARYENRLAADAVRFAASRAGDVQDAAHQWREAARAQVRACVSNESGPAQPDKPQRNGPVPGPPPATASPRSGDRIARWAPRPARRARTGTTDREAGR